MVKLKLDKERSFELDLNAIIKYEELTGKSLLKKQEAPEMGAGDLRALLYVGLLREDPNLTIEQVGSFITIENMAEVAKAIGDAWKAGKEPGPLA